MILRLPIDHAVPFFITLAISILICCGIITHVAADVDSAAGAAHSAPGWENTSAAALKHYRAGLAALGQSQSARKALTEFEAASVADASFLPAYRQIGLLRLRLGEYDLAAQAFEHAGKAAEEKDHNAVRLASGYAEACHSARDWSSGRACPDACNEAVMISDLVPELHLRRAECARLAGDQGDYQSYMLLYYGVMPWVSSALLDDAVFHFFDLFDKPTSALAIIKQAIAADPEDPAIPKIRRYVKNTARELELLDEDLTKGRLDSAEARLASSIKTVLERSTDWISKNPAMRMDHTALVQRFADAICEILLQRQSVSLELQDLVRSSEKTPETAPCLALKANGQIRQKSFDQALETLRVAEEHAKKEDLSRILGKIVRLREKAQRLKQKLHERTHQSQSAKMPDYYKELDVDRSASEADLKHAYRKKSKLYHPDRAQHNGLSKEQAEEKMLQLNAAYGVLTDPEQRRLYDSGIDPNDPHAMHQQPRQGQPPPNFHFMKPNGQQGHRFHFGKTGHQPAGGGPDPFDDFVRQMKSQTRKMEEQVRKMTGFPPGGGHQGF